MSVPPYFYETQIKWAGQRRGSVASAGLPKLEISTPPEFKGEPGFWTPEHLYVAAAEACLMATFIGIAENSKLAVAGYQSSARGRLERIHFSRDYTSQFRGSRTGRAHSGEGGKELPDRQFDADEDSRGSDIYPENGARGLIVDGKIRC
jgi:hypothetical protein